MWCPSPSTSQHCITAACVVNVSTKTVCSSSKQDKVNILSIFCENNGCLSVMNKHFSLLSATALQAAGLMLLRQRLPKIGSIPIDEVATVRIAGNVVTPTKHGSQHSVFKPPQRGEACGEVCTPNVERDHLWEL